MTNIPGDVARALKDALPSLDYNKLVGEARRQFGLVVIGDAEQADMLLDLLRHGGRVPTDVKGAAWRHGQGGSAPVPLGKTELAIVIPATEANMQQAREHFGGVATLPVLLPDTVAAAGLNNPLSVAALDEAQVRKVLVPEIVDRLWERRLALGRTLPAVRDRVAWRLIRHATRDFKLFLGTVAGAGSGRNGSLTPATATLLIHQAVLIVSMAAVYGADLDDRRSVFARVAPQLAPTVLLDGAEAIVSKAAAGWGKDRRYGKWYGPMAAYALRPALSTSSTALAGLVAMRVFRGTVDRPSVVARTRALGKRALAGAGQAADLVGVLATRRRRLDAEEDQPAEVEQDLPRAAEAPVVDPSVDEPRAAEHTEPES